MHSFISANCNCIELGLDDFCVCLLQTLFGKERERERERRVKLRFFLGNKIRVLFNFKTVVHSDLSGFVCNKTGTNFEGFWLHDLLTSQFCFFFFWVSSLFLVCIIFLQVSFFCLPVPSSISLSDCYFLQSTNCNGVVSCKNCARKKV